MASLLRRRTVVVPVALTLVAGGGAVAWASSSGGGSHYRTAQVTRGDVEQYLNLTGTVSAVNQAKARFRTSGTVGSVKVTVGQTVAKGQLLATMDAGPLQDAVTKATETLATAKATLETDSSSSSSSATSSSGTSSTAKSGGAGGALAAAQQAAARALKAAESALATATTACAGTASPSSSPSSSPSTTPTATPTPVVTGSPSAARRSSSAPGGGPVTGALSCTDALLASLHAQQAAAAAQQRLGTALTASGSSSTSSTPSSSRNSASAGSGGTTSTAARITRDTAAVSAAQVSLTEAQKDLAAVSLLAPLSGTVATIPWAVGDAASASDAVVILGSGPVNVTVNVPSTSIRSVRVGLPATVRADGGTRTLDGEMTQIGLLPTSSTSTSSSTATYPVTVGVAAGAGLVDGSSAAVSIVVKTVKDVITVPNSALHNGSVDVLSHGKVATVRLQTGAVGALLTEVTSGLTVGQTVVLADLSAALPTSSTTSTRVGGTFGGPGFGGGGFAPPGGFGGGGFTGPRS